ncbi:hypothetical protein GCM10023149_54110 [Mucilaginibacter gynuensis]|uniref:Tail length tape measure protein n=1 Tax=Mucilaginibacter gynuensis TaxID=1302236 RepID=A0ABP8HN24_9SPHI
MATQQENAVINLVINGQQAIGTFRDLNRARSEQIRLVQTLNRNAPNYAEQQRRLEDLNAAHREWRAEIARGTREQKGFFDSFKDGFTEMAGNITAGTLIFKGISAGIGFIKDLWNGSEAAYQEAVKGQAQLDAALKSTQNISGQTKQGLSDLAGELMNLTGIDDDVISKGEQILLTFTNIRGGIYEDALPAIVDMTAAMNQGEVSMEGIQGTAIQVGKALNDPIKGMTALAKVGVAFSAQQKEQITTLVETNRLQEAQAIILKELQKEFGGVAKAVADTDAGALQKMQTRLGNIQESIGAWITKGKGLAVDVLNPLLGWVEDFVGTPLSETLHEDQRSFLGLRLELESNNTTAERRVEIINQLKSQYPGYLSQVDSDKVKNSELLPILEKINEAFVLRIAYQQRSEKLDKAIKDEAEAMNNKYDQQQKLIMRISEIQQSIGEDGIKFTIKGNNENEKAVFIYKNLLNSIREQAKGNSDLNNILASNKYDLLIQGLNSYGNAIVSSNEKLKDSRAETKRLTDDLNDFKKQSGYNDKIPGADLLDELANKSKILTVVMDGAKKGSAEYIKMVDALKKANEELKSGAGSPEAVSNIKKTLAEIDNLIKPQSGPSQDTLNKQRAAAEKAAKELEKYKSELQTLLEQTNQIVASAKKGTTEEVLAQLQVIDDKYNQIIQKANKLRNDKNSSPEDRKAIDEAIGNNRDAALLEKTNYGDNAGFKNDQSVLNDQYAAEQQALKDKYAQQLITEDEYNQQQLALEQSHLMDEYFLRISWYQNTADLEAKMTDNKIKQDKKAYDAKLKTIKDQQQAEQAYLRIQQAISNERNQLAMTGVSILSAVFGKSKGIMLAQLAVEKAIAIGRIIANEGIEIAGYWAFNAPLGPAGWATATALTTAAKVRAGLSILNVVGQGIAQGITSLSGDSGSDNSQQQQGSISANSSTGSRRFATGGILPNGPTHASGGINLVGPYGQIYGQVEGGEPILSRQTYANNRGVIDALLNSGGAMLDFERVIQATTDREARRSSTFAAGNANAGVSTSTADAGVQQMTFYNERLERMERLMENQLKINEKPVTFSRRVADEEDARVIQIKNNANA